MPLDIYDEKDGILVNLKKFAYINLPFIIALLVCVCIIIQYTDKNIVSGLITIILLQMWSYFSHILGHTNVPLINWHLLHHKPEVSRKPLYVLLEFYINFMFSGGFILIFYLIAFKQLFNIDFGINNYIVLFWSLVYSTYHLFNYHYLDFDTHDNHHKNNNCNYAPDWMDIMFKTKTNGEHIENMNSSIINIIVSMLIVVQLKGTKYDLITIISYCINKIIQYFYKI